MSTIHDQRYNLMITQLIQIRNEKNITQVELAKKISKQQSYISKTEGLERRLDVIELIDWLNAMEFLPNLFLKELSFCKVLPEAIK